MLAPAIAVVGSPVIGDIASFGSFPGLPGSFSAIVDRIANPFTTITDGTSLAVDTLPLLLPPFSGRVGFIHLGTIVDVGVWDFNNLDPRPTEFTIISVSFQAHAPGTVNMALLPPIGGKHLSNDGLPIAIELLTASVTVVDAVPLPASGLLLSSTHTTCSCSAETAKTV